MCKIKVVLIHFRFNFYMFNPDQAKSLSVENREWPPVVVAGPAAESLLYFKSQDSFWPEAIKNNPELQAQAELRLEILAELEKVFARVPRADMAVSEALEKN